MNKSIILTLLSVLFLVGILMELSITKQPFKKTLAKKGVSNLQHINFKGEKG